MRSTTRTRLYKRDITEWIEWGTPLGSIEFEPVDNDYKNYKTDNRLFNMIILQDSWNDKTTFTDTAENLIKQYNQMVNVNRM